MQIFHGHSNKLLTQTLLLTVVGNDVSIVITITGCIKFLKMLNVGSVGKPGVGLVIAISGDCEIISQLLVDPQSRF
jgi:hypothetical protein